MWLELSTGAEHRLRLSNRQAIWPAPDGSDAELVVSTRAELDQRVVLATPRVARLEYVVRHIRATMAIDNGPQHPWADAAAVSGQRFEVMITERGALVVPSQGPRLPDTQAAWLATVAEDVRSAWVVPPEGAGVGSEWHVVPIVPGGLPPGTARADVDVSYVLAAKRASTAEFKVAFEVRLVVEKTRAVHLTGVGRGTMTIHADPSTGTRDAVRAGTVELSQQSRTRQVIRSRMELGRS